MEHQRRFVEGDPQAQVLIEALEESGASFYTERIPTTKSQYGKDTYDKIAHIRIISWNGPVPEGFDAD